MAPTAGSLSKRSARSFRLICQRSEPTAISARRGDWLEASAKVAAERHASGELNDEPFAALEAIIEQARDGQWEAAEGDVIRLSKAQKPSAEEIEHSKAKRKAGP